MPSAMCLISISYKHYLANLIDVVDMRLEVALKGPSLAKHQRIIWVQLVSPSMSISGQNVVGKEKRT